MFPVTDNSQTIIDTLIHEMNRYKVQLQYHTEVKKIEKHDGQFRLETNQGILQADFVCVASGGYPKSFLFDWIKTTGHSIESRVPSLFTFNMPGHKLCALMGVAVNAARVQIAGTSFKQEGPVLITHWGISGPAVLKLSAWAARFLAEKHYVFQAIINWIPSYTTASLQTQWPGFQQQYAKLKMYGKNPFNLPNRLWQYLLNEATINESSNWASVTAKQKKHPYSIAHSIYL